ncbi:TetR/AcrR family transcriptional regulator [Streptomyces sp. NPDC058818]|uniref:TetR/AcrR family transcriptional regulator n=1 Tax=Streptomyces sp. NPDC058818 TaxID=3346640 RepID=UPI003692B7AC
MAEGRIPAERRRRRPTKTGVVLSEELIVDCALRLVGQHGPDALSVRRLGTALGCDPSALYRYFRGSDEVLLAVTDRLIGEAMAGFAPGDGTDWAAGLREMARRVHHCFSAHPRIAALAAYRVTRRVHEFRAVDTGIGLLRRAGFDAETAVRHYAAFIDTVLGHAALDAAHLALAPELRRADDAAWTQAYQDLPDDSYPELAVVRPHLPLMAAGSFAPAVELLLAALAAQAREAAQASGRGRGPRPGRGGTGSS